ncbi:MAG: PEP/pyruvate-binding domain-containing protein, partial [Planctomycetota bacterium]
PRAMDRYEQEKGQYEAAKLPVFLPKDLHVDIVFLALNHAESYGRLRLMRLDERPSPRDVVLYQTLPNEMPRVAGVITSVRQTPLSHVNLRAIQDKVPNAFVADAADNKEITGLIGKYVYYKVDADGYEIREATGGEVDAHFAELRPKERQVPPRDLSVKTIRPLDDIGFKDSSNVGVKAANLATMRGFRFPAGTIPDGFGVPFHFYDAFMKHNGFYRKVSAMRAVPDFQKDTDASEKALVKISKKMVKGKMPDWMAEALGKMQKAFPQGTHIRCRSSTNNEDLPGFSGAGLYGSFTHVPGGHIGKTIRLVYASLWNFRAYEEREFYRIDHLASAMGVLVHPNYANEKANGVAVADDIVYQTGRNFYVNTQVGEDMITNPEAQSIPEEVILHPSETGQDRIVRYSNRVEGEKQILTPAQRNELATRLGTIQRKFCELYGRSPRAFAMEIEFKITAEGKLAIKQARPWVY